MRSFDASKYWATHHLQLSVIAHIGQEKEKMANSVPKPQEAFNPYEDYPSGRHLSENVENFLRRMPPLSTSIVDYGPWIYIANPFCPKSQPGEDQATFVRRGLQLLKEFTVARVGIERSMPGKAKSVIGRKVTPPTYSIGTRILKSGLP